MAMLTTYSTDDFTVVLHLLTTNLAKSVSVTDVLSSALLGMEVGINRQLVVVEHWWDSLNQGQVKCGFKHTPTKNPLLSLPIRPPCRTYSAINRTP